MPLKLANLTREDARKRAAMLDVEHYDIDLDLTKGEKTFRAKTTITFTADTSISDSTFIDITAEKIYSATLNGTPLDVSHYNCSQGFPLEGLQKKNELFFDTEMEYTNTGEGLDRFVDPADNKVYLYSQCAPSDADRIFPCFDQPNLKATFTIHVTAPTDWIVLSNAPLESQDGEKRTFKTTKKQSTYLFAIIAGPYVGFTDEYSDEYGTIPLGIYARDSLKPYVDADRIFSTTKQGFKFYNQKFGLPYQFDKYDQIFCPAFNAGAMENIGAVTFFEDYLFRSAVTDYQYERRAETILHELAHMWFGDLVTMNWFDDLWLNESFATFISILTQTEATEYTKAWTTFATVDKSWAARQDQLASSTHPIAADIVDVHAAEVNFDGITYAKGASVLKQLAAYVGKEEFFQGLRDYFDKHKWANATFKDLLSSLEDASGRDLSQWGQEWLQTTGINTLEAQYTIDNGVYSSFAVKQGGAQPGKGEVRTHRIAIGVYADNGSGKLERTNRVELDITDATTQVPELIGKPAGEFVLVNDDDLTYATIILDPISRANVLKRIGDVTDSLARALLWSSLWEATRNAQLKPRDFIALVEKNAPTITETSVLEKVLLQANSAVYRYSDPQWSASEGRDRFAEKLLSFARQADAGSDAQLAFFLSYLTNLITNNESLDMLEGLLHGKKPEEYGLKGITLGTDLRWRVVLALAAAGRLTKDDIDQEKTKDNTDSGDRFAAKAIAAIPTKEAKEHTWKTLFDNCPLSNLQARWVTAGFVYPGQDNLLQPFTQQYCDTIVSVWNATTSGELARTLAAGVFPYWSDDKETVTAIEKIYHDTTTPSGLRRLLGEGLDDMKRLQETRAFDRGETS